MEKEKMPSVNPLTGNLRAPLAVPGGNEPAAVSCTADGTEFITAAARLPLFGTLEVKIDTSDYIGPEGSSVRQDGQVIGHVGTSLYAARTLQLGGETILAGENGEAALRAMLSLVHGETVPMKIDSGAELALTAGQAPVINGRRVDTTTFGCGSSVGKGFSHVLIPVVDECIMLDMGITGQMSEHHAALGAKPCGITVIGKRSTPGRWMVPSGDGWGGTCVKDPRDAIAAVDREKAWPGLRILVLDTYVQHYAYMELNENYEPVILPVPENVGKVLEYMKQFCDPGCVSAMLVAGLDGSAAPLLRDGCSTERLHEEIRKGTVLLTVGGAPVYDYPGRHLNFTVNTALIARGGLTNAGTRLSVPVELTMKRSLWAELGAVSVPVSPLN